jgi:hypothetical protein
MIVDLRMPLTDEGERRVELSVVPRVGETVEVNDDPWVVRQVVHRPTEPGVETQPPYVVLWKEYVP